MHIRSLISTLKCRWPVSFVVMLGLALVGLWLPIAYVQSDQAVTTLKKPARNKPRVKKTLDLDIQPQTLEGATTSALLPGKYISTPGKPLKHGKGTLLQPRLTLEVQESNQTDVKCLTDTCRYKQMLDKQTEIPLQPRDILRQTPKLRFEMKY